MKYQVKYVDVMDTQAVELPEGSIVIDADPLVEIAGSRTWYQKLSDFLRGREPTPMSERHAEAYKHGYPGWRITYLEPVFGK